MSDALWDSIESAVFSEMERVGSEMQNYIRESISTPCPNYAWKIAGGTGRPPPHSPQGQPPYLENGDLYKSVTYGMSGNRGENPQLGVWADRPYARRLERIRPFMAPAQKHWLPILVQRLRTAATTAGQAAARTT